MLQKTVDNLKERSKDERQVVAGGVAVTVVVILLVAWAIFFLKRIQSGNQELNLDSGAQSEFNFTSTKEAQDAIKASQGQNYTDLQGLRDDAATNQLQGQQQIYLQEIGGNSDQFGDPSF